LSPQTLEISSLLDCSQPLALLASILVCSNILILFLPLWLWLLPQSLSHWCALRSLLTPQIDHLIIDDLSHPHHVYLLSCELHDPREYHSNCRVLPRSEL
jgi:hypothetical protein